MDSPKRVLVLLGDLDTRGVPAVILHAAGIRPDGIVAVDVPRFPRVSDVKHALWRDLRIPCADQVLQGPWPDTAVLSRDWVHLRKYGVFPGLGGSKSTRSSRGKSTLETAQPGELFSTAAPITERVDEDGATISDILRLTTKQPITEYLPGGAIYMRRLKRQWWLSAAIRTIAGIMLAAAIFYILWLVPGYEMPDYSKPVINTEVETPWPAPGSAGNSSAYGMPGQPAAGGLEDRGKSVAGNQHKPRQDEL